MRSRDRCPVCGSANQSPPHIEPVSGTPKRKLENGEQRLPPQNTRSRAESSEIAGRRLRRASLTHGNVGGSHTPGNHVAETRPAGWGGRIRTSVWRNQNPLPYRLATPHRPARPPMRADHTCPLAGNQRPGGSAGIRPFDTAQDFPDWPILGL